MATVTVRDLRNHGGEVLDRVTRGELITVTRSGRPIAELRAIAQPAFSSERLLERWGRLPAVNPTRVRAELDELFDSSF